MQENQIIIGSILFFNLIALSDFYHHMSLESHNDDAPVHDHSKDLIVHEGFAVLNSFIVDKSNNDMTHDKPDPVPRYPFASFLSAVEINMKELDNIMHDCELAFTARTREDSESYSTGATFFMPAVMKPRCALEALAMDIFEAHTKGLDPGQDYDPERSGAEYWTLVLENKPKEQRIFSKDQDDDDDGSDEDDDEVGMHFDADYGLEQQLPNYMLHPRIATVTYFSNVGCPTLILNKKSPPPSDVQKSSLLEPIQQGWLSHPIMGKHIAFDGRFLHGAPATFFPSLSLSKSHLTDTEPDAKRRRLEDDKESHEELISPGKRVTFLVNVWLNHCPIDAELLDDELVSQMKSSWKSKDINMKNDEAGKHETMAFHWSLDDVTKISNHDDKITIQKATNENEYAGEENVILCNREVDVKFCASMQNFHLASLKALETNDKSIQLVLNPGVIDLVVGAEVHESDGEDSKNDEQDE